MNDDKEQWKDREPWVVQDPGFKREWLSVEPLQYYLGQNDEGQWTVIDRWWDLNKGGYHKTREAAIRAFYKSVGRKIRTGTTLGRFKDSNYRG